MRAKCGHYVTGETTSAMLGKRSLCHECKRCTECCVCGEGFKGLPIKENRCSLGSAGYWFDE